MSTKWNQFLQHLLEIAQLTFPRWFNYQSDYDIEIHGFCDALQQVISAVVYIRSTTKDGKTTSNLVCSKTKVAPLKKLTIPRLELSGAIMFTKLVDHFLPTLNSTGTPVDRFCRYIHLDRQSPSSLERFRTESCMLYSGDVASDNLEIYIRHRQSCRLCFSRRNPSSTFRTSNVVDRTFVASSRFINVAICASIAIPKGQPGGKSSSSLHSYY